MEIKEQLPAFVLAELYGKSLVVTEPGKKQELKTDVEKTKAKYLGSYQKKIIVLVNDADNIYLSDESLQFLTGILNACKLNLAHIALINFNNNAVSFSQLKKDMQPAFLLAFGVTTLQIDLPFDMPQYQVQDYSNCFIVTAPSLDEINQSTQKAKTEKNKLWLCLRRIFNLEK